MPIKVAIVDDSALIRQVLTSLLEKDPEIEIVGTASDPYQARELIKKTHPDVLTLDVEMPRMDGLTFLEKIMTLRPMAVVMVSTLTQNGAETTLRALEIGAVDYVAKPTLDMERGMQDKAEELITKVKMAARAKISAASASKIKVKPTTSGYKMTEKIIGIGSSTGGVEALKRLLIPLPADCPAIMITQHMPPSFTTSFAQRLDTQCAMKVKEAEDGDRVLPGHVYIAPGSHHIRLTKSGANFVIRLDDSAPVTGHKPSVDVMFESIAKVAGANALGVILTGMGKDGAKGLKSIRDKGAYTIGQDEGSSVVYGMPRAAFELGGVTKQYTLSQIPDAILEHCSESSVRKIRI